MPMCLSPHDLFLLKRFCESLGGELRREGRGLPSPHPGFFSRGDFITHLVSNSNGGIAGLFVPVPVSPDPVLCKNDFDPPGLAGLHKRRQVHCGDVESGLRNGIAKLLVKGGLVATLFVPVRVPRPCVQGLEDLHAFLTHKGIVDTLDLPVHTEIPRAFAGHRVVVQDGDVCVHTMVRNPRQGLAQCDPSTNPELHVLYEGHIRAGRHGDFSVVLCGPLQPRTVVDVNQRFRFTNFPKLTSTSPRQSKFETMLLSGYRNFPRACWAGSSWVR